MGAGQDAKPARMNVLPSSGHFGNRAYNVLSIEGFADWHGGSSERLIVEARVFGGHQYDERAQADIRNSPSQFKIVDSRHCGVRNDEVETLMGTRCQRVLTVFGDLDPHRERPSSALI